MEQLTIVKKNSKCHFCGISKNDYLRYGPIYKLGKVTAHYYCVLLSHNLLQNGKDDEGILGFLLSDIENALRRASNILCTYCKKGNATIVCSASKCKKCFHLPCGLKKGTSHQFVCEFKSFCDVHRLVQNIPPKILKEACESEVICCICQEKVDVQAKSDTLWAPCCLRTWYHRNCVQKLAHSAGYFCRCPVCNDAKKFNKCIQEFGIFIPQQDASWELAPNAFEDLLFRYNSCDAEQCRCPDGRQNNTENTLWEIILCDSCGSQGIHVACGNLKFLDPEWECGPCRKITRNVNSCGTEVSDSFKTDVTSAKSEITRKKRRRNSEDLEKSHLDNRKKCRMSVEEEIEIDVETVDEEVTEGKTSTGEHEKLGNGGGRAPLLRAALAGSAEASVERSRGPDESGDDTWELAANALEDLLRSDSFKRDWEGCGKKRRRNSDDLENSVLDKRKKRRTSVEEIEMDFETAEEKVRDDKTSKALAGGPEGSVHLDRSAAPEKSGQTGHVPAEAVMAALRRNPQEGKMTRRFGRESYPAVVKERRKKRGRLLLVTSSRARSGEAPPGLYWP